MGNRYLCKWIWYTVSSKRKVIDNFNDVNITDPKEVSQAASKLPRNKRAQKLVKVLEEFKTSYHWVRIHHYYL